MDHGRRAGWAQPSVQKPELLGCLVDAHPAQMPKAREVVAQVVGDEGRGACGKASGRRQHRGQEPLRSHTRSPTRGRRWAGRRRSRSASKSPRRRAAPARSPRPYAWLGAQRPSCAAPANTKFPMSTVSTYHLGPSARRWPRRLAAGPRRPRQQTGAPIPQRPPEHVKARDQDQIEHHLSSFRVNGDAPSRPEERSSQIGLQRPHVVLAVKEDRSRLPS